MAADDPATPSEKALSLLRHRIAVDDGIDNAVREAVLADLASANPAAFQHLRAALTAEGQGDEAEEPESP